MVRRKLYSTTMGLTRCYVYFTRSFCKILSSANRVTTLFLHSSSVSGCFITSSPCSNACRVAMSSLNSLTPVRTLLRRSHFRDPSTYRARSGRPRSRYVSRKNSSLGDKALSLRKNASLRRAQGAAKASALQLR